MPIVCNEEGKKDECNDTMTVTTGRFTILYNFTWVPFPHLFDYLWLVSFMSHICCCFHRCDSLERLKKKCESLDKEIEDSLKFKDFYQFTFNFAKNLGQKGLGKCFLVSSR